MMQEARETVDWERRGWTYAMALLPRWQRCIVKQALTGQRISKSSFWPGLARDTGVYD